MKKNNQLKNWTRLHLIPNFKNWYKFWSVKLAAFGALLLSAGLLLPDFIYQSWLLLPPELKDVMPANWTQYMALAVFVASIFARFVKQPKLEIKNEN